MWSQSLTLVTIKARSYKMFIKVSSRTLSSLNLPFHGVHQTMKSGPPPLVATKGPVFLKISWTGCCLAQKSKKCGRNSYRSSKLLVPAIKWLRRRKRDKDSLCSSIACWLWPRKPNTRSLWKQCIFLTGLMLVSRKRSTSSKKWWSTINIIISNSNNLLK